MSTELKPYRCERIDCENRACKEHGALLVSREPGHIRTMSAHRKWMETMARISPNVLLVSFETELTLICIDNEAYQRRLVRAGVAKDVARDLAFDQLRDSIGMLVRAARDTTVKLRETS